MPASYRPNPRFFRPLFSTKICVKVNRRIGNYFLVMMKNRALPWLPNKSSFAKSLFQLKDEPEGEGIRQLRKAPFGF
jgi:hypothetical protein